MGDTELYSLADAGSIEELASLLSEEVFSQSTLDEALHRAVLHCLSASDHLDCISTLINYGAATNFKDSGGVSLLMKAARLGQIQLVQELLSRGADVKHRDAALKSVLHHALESDFGDNGDVVKMLIDKGAEVNQRDQTGAMEVHKAAERGYLSSLFHLLEAKALVNAADEAGNTPLHLAAVNQHVECVRELLRHGGKVNIRNKQGLTVGSFAGAEVLSILGSDASEASLAENGEVVDKAVQTCGDLEQAQEACAEVIAAIKAERLRQDALEAEAEQLANSISALRAARDLQLAAFQARHSALCEDLRKVQNRHDHSRKTAQPSLLFPSTAPQIYTLEELESALERDMDDLCAQVDAWQVMKRAAHEEVVAYWQTLVRETVPGASVHVYGSYATGLHLPASDIDLVICDSQYAVVPTLELLYEKVGKMAQIHDQRLITTAVIPVLRLTLSTYDVKVDLTVQEASHRGLKCTQVCQALLGKHPLLRKVFLPLKFLLHYGEANEAFKGGLGSYGLLLMIAGLLEHRRTATPAASLIDFFKYFLHEFDYLTAVGSEGPTFEEPCLFLPDPCHPQSNVTRSTNLEFLLQFLQVAEDQLWQRPFCGCSLPPLATMVRQTREWMCRA